MNDEVTTAIAIAKAGQSIISLLGEISKIKDTNTISAYFDYNGERIHGNEKIVVEKHPDTKSEKENVWWFSVQEIPEYTFERFPVGSQSVYELIANAPGEKTLTLDIGGGFLQEYRVLFTPAVAIPQTSKLTLL